MKKRIIAVITVLAMMMSLAACGKSPSDCVKQELDVVKSASSESLIQEALNGANIEDNELLEPLVAKLQDFDYEVVDEKVDGDTAVVTVKVTTYPFGVLLKGTYDELVEQAMKGELGDLDEKALTQKLYEPMINATDKTYVQDVEIKCTKNGAGWEGNYEENNEFLDAVFGGLMSAMASL